MGREIKFRAWNGKRIIAGQPFWSCITNWRGLENAELELMQFTGLTDRHGKEIYESDLITFAMPNNKAMIVWDDDHARFGMQLIDKKGELFGQIDSLDGSFEVEAEVIGNKYES